MGPCKLCPREVYITRQAGTEYAYSSNLNKFYEPGIYHCADCDQPLFSSVTKYDSHTGWPSFWAPIAKNIIAEKEDYKLFLIKRIEVLCNRCGAHLGHVFTDGPPPTGLRYCLNGLALKFVGDGGRIVQGTGRI